MADNDLQQATDDSAPLPPAAHWQSEGGWSPAAGSGLTMDDAQDAQSFFGTPNIAAPTREHEVGRFFEGVRAAATPLIGPSDEQQLEEGGQYKPFGSEIEQHGLLSAVGAPAMGAWGRTKAAVADVAAAAGGDESFANTKAEAVREAQPWSDQGQIQTPYEKAQAGETGFSGWLDRAATEQLPDIANRFVLAGPLGEAGEAAGLSQGTAHAIASGIAFGQQQDGSIDPYQAAIMAVLPAIGDMGAKAVSRAINAPVTGEVKIGYNLDQDPTALKVLQGFMGEPAVRSELAAKALEEIVGRGGAQTAFLTASQLPQIAELPDDQRDQAIAETVGYGMAFSLLSMPGVIDPRVPSGARQEIVGRVMGDIARQFEQSPRLGTETEGEQNAPSQERQQTGVPAERPGTVAGQQGQAAVPAAPAEANTGNIVPGQTTGQGAQWSPAPVAPPQQTPITTPRNEPTQPPVIPATTAPVAPVRPAPVASPPVVPPVEAQRQTARAQTEPNPTPEEKESGEYQKGVVTLHGFQFAIENPKGSVRTGVGEDGKPWSVTMQHDYGEIVGTKGADGDPLDAYLGPNLNSPHVYVVDQMNPATGKPDEHKTLWGFNSGEEAIRAYDAGFSDATGARRLGAVTQMTVPEFKEWLAKGDMTEPATAYAAQYNQRTPEVEATKPPPNAPAPREQKRFLLDAIGEAIGNAPASLPPTEHEPLLKRIDSGEFSHWQSGDSDQTFEARRTAALEPLFRQYAVPVVGIPPTADGGVLPMGVKPVPLTTDQRITELRRAAEKADYAAKPKVTIDVPGDGTFEVVDSKPALRDFEKRAQKFPTSQPRKSAPSTRSEPTAPAPIGELDQPNIVAALKPVLDSDPSKGEKGPRIYLWSDGKQTVATNGRMLTLARAGLKGARKGGTLYDASGKLAKTDLQYPNWPAVVPGPRQIVRTFQKVDTDWLFRAVKQAAQVTTEENKLPKIGFCSNPDGSIGVYGESPDVGSYQTNVQKGAKPLFAARPDYVIDALNAARRLGDQTVDLAYIDELSPFQFIGKNSLSVVAPMRLEGGLSLPEPIYEQSTKQPAAPPGAGSSVPANPNTAAEHGAAGATGAIATPAVEPTPSAPRKRTRASGERGGLGGPDGGSVRGNPPEPPTAERNANAPAPQAAASAPATAHGGGVNPPSGESGGVATAAPGKPAGGRVVIARAALTPKFDESSIPAALDQFLDPHQRQGVAAALQSLDKRGGFGLFDGTGVGKSRQALAVASAWASKGAPVVIVTKAETIRPDWKKQTFGGSYASDAKTMGVPITLARDGKVAPGQIGITTYENLPSLRRNLDPNALIIFDESHALKNADSSRGRDGLRVIQKAKGVLYMSATPADKPLHIEYLGRIGILEGKTLPQTWRALGLYPMEIRAARGRRVTRWQIDGNVGAQEVQRRYSALFDRLTAAGAMIKREISMDGVSVEVRRLALPKEAHDEINKIAPFFGYADHNEAPGLMKARILMHERRQQEPYKIGEAVSLTKQELAQGNQVVIFVSRVNESGVGKWVEMPNGDRVREELMRTEGTAQTLKDALAKEGITDVAEIHGNAEGKISDAMQAFQAKKARVTLATVESGGTGIDLDDTVGDAPRSMLMLTAPFSAVENVQAAGRIWRLKTKSPARIVYLFGDTPVDAWNASIIGSKMKQLGATVGGQVRRLDIHDPDMVAAEDFEEKPKPQAQKPTGIEAMARWSEPKTVETRYGPRILRTADVTPELRAAHFEELREKGVVLGRYQGKEQAQWWQKPKASLAAAEPPQPFPVEQAQAVVREVRADLPNAPKVTIVNDPDMRQNGRVVAGMSHKGAVVINVAGIQSEAHLREVLAEEIIGHYGVEAALGDGAFHRAIDQLGRGITDETLAPIAQQYGLDLEEPEHRRVAVIEHLAKQANLDEEPDKRGFWGRLWDAIKGALRRLFGIQEPTDDLIRDILARARSYLEGRAPAAGGGSAEPRASVAPEGVPHTVLGKETTVGSRSQMAPPEERAAAADAFFAPHFAAEPVLEVDPRRPGHVSRVQRFTLQPSFDRRKWLADLQERRSNPAYFGRGLNGDIFNSLTVAASRGWLPLDPDTLRATMEIVRGHQSMLGVELGASGHNSVDLASVAAHPEWHLQQVWRDGLGGAEIGDVTRRIQEEAAKEFGPEDAAKAAAASPEMPVQEREAQKAFMQPVYNRIVQAIDRMFVARAAPTVKRMQNNARVREAIDQIVANAKALGLKEPPQPGKTRLAPEERLRLMTQEPDGPLKIQDAIEQAVADAERNAGFAAWKNAAANDPVEQQKLQEALTNRDDPPREMIEKGLEMPRYAHWKVIRDGLLDYSPTTIKLARDVLQGRFRGAQFAAKPEPKPETRIRLDELAKSPDAEVQRVVDAQVDEVKAVMDKASDATKQRVLGLIRDDIAGQLARIRAQLRDPLFLDRAPQQAPGRSQVLTNQRIAELINAKLFEDGRLDDQQAVDRVASQAAFQRILPRIDDLIRQIFSAPPTTQERLKQDFVDGMLAKFAVSPQQAQKAWAVFNAAIQQKWRDARVKAGQKAAESLTPREKTVLQGRGNRGKLEKIIANTNAGNFDSADILQQIAAKAGWRVPSEEEVERLKRMGLRFQELTQLSDERRKIMADESLTDAQKAQRIVDDTGKKKAALGAEIAQLTHKMSAAWASIERPIGHRGFLGLRRVEGAKVQPAAAAASAAQEFATLSTLFTHAYPFHIVLHLGSQGAVQSLAQTLEVPWTQFVNDRAAGRENRLLPDVATAVHDFWRGSMASVKATAAQMEQEVKGRGLGRNTYGLNQGVNAMQRLVDKAEALLAQAKAKRAAGDAVGAGIASAKALAAYAYSMPRLMTWWVNAVDAMQGTPIERQEILNQVAIAMRQQGKTPAEIEALKQDVLNTLTDGLAAAQAEAEAWFAEVGITPKPADLRAAAHRVATERAYLKAAAAGLPADDFRGRTALLRRALAWEDEVKHGAGGIGADLVRGVTRPLTRAGIPPAIAILANAAGHSVNYALMCLPVLNRLGTWDYADRGPSPHRVDARAARQRTLQWMISMSVALPLIMLMLAGKARYNAHYPRSKNERDKFIAEGHRVGSFEIDLPDGRFLAGGANVFWTPVRPFVGGAQSVIDVFARRAAAQQEENERAAKAGLQPRQLPMPGDAEIANAAGKGVVAAVFQSSVLSGLVNELSAAGDFVSKKAIGALAQKFILGGPELAAIAQAEGVNLDPRVASVWNWMVPIAATGAEQRNVFGDAVKSPSGLQRVIAQLTGGTYGPMDPAQDPNYRAYQTLQASGYMPPAINAGQGYSVGGEYRPLNQQEAETYAANRGEAFKAAVAALPADASHADVEQAFTRANAQALGSVGASVINPRASASAQTPAPSAQYSSQAAQTQARFVPGSSRGLHAASFGRAGLRAPRASRVTAAFQDFRGSGLRSRGPGVSLGFHRRR